MSFRVSLPVRFADCDPAGIAYFPRLLALVDAAIEDWTAHVLGVDRQGLHAGMRLGLPTVMLESAFLSPARLGDLLDFEVGVTRLGTTSVGLAVTAAVAERPCLEARLVQVLTNLDTMRPSPWPESWRARICPIKEEMPS
jgi:4-hydroxybenzoyl-CoA thioesterase